MQFDYNSCVIRILIASPFPAMRAGLRALLNDPDLSIIGEAINDEQALALGESLMPQVLLYDLALDHDATFSTISQIKQNAPGVRVLALSDSSSDSRMMRALQAGTRGCLSKIANADELTLAVRQITEGELVLPPTAASTVLQQLSSGSSAEVLSPRELQVVRGVADGLTNKAIALKLGISDHTVKFHLASAMSKMGAASRAEAVALAIQRGWISL
jgi:DNA-binding NarL/FixJ family response regulator